MANDDQMQGEGNYDAARRYRKGQEDFAKQTSRVDKAAHEAEDALDGPEGAELERARQETGKIKPR
ncbi:MAG TPA: hypothetical protein VGM25_08925 [Caulobacteraceae bacterium]|jgi:hypothetical protein